jgi:hypothetical protein
MPEMNIKTVDENGTFEDVMVEASAEIKEIAYSIRALLAEVMPGITEVPWSHQKTIGYGVGAKKMSEHFCYIAPQKNYVNLGFMYGANLPDPQKLLEGNGQLLRHIKIRTLEDVQRPALRKLVEEASMHLPKLKK